MDHPILPSCRGVRCTICGGQAHHKVGEEFLHGQREIEAKVIGFPPEAKFGAARHNLTAYLCCWHFRQVMGGTATNWCEPKAWDRDRYSLPQGL
jgi:hypothetical protein